MVAQGIKIEIPRTLEPIQLPPLPNNPLVSVLMANYNYAAFIGNAIESVLSQTYRNFELIVSDDGSTDNSCDVVEALAGRDSRVRLVHGETNAGQTTAINRAYAASHGQIICFIDSDDRYVPDKLERVVNRLREKPNAGLLLNRLLSVDADGNPIQEIPFMTTFAEGWIAEQLLQNGGDWPVTPFCGLNMRREVTDLVFPLPNNRTRAGNSGGLFRVIGPLLTEVTGINEPLYRYRIHGQNSYGATTLTLERVNHDCAEQEWSNTQIQRIMTDLGIPERAVDLCRSLQYIRWTFERSLLMGTPRRRLIRSLAPLSRRIFSDPDSQTSRKVVRLGVYSIAVLLPFHLRVRWLNLALGRSASKQALSKLLGSFRGLPGHDARRLRQGDVS